VFNTLSGGQQAMAALALSLAISNVFPCSLAIYDEIDANV
jgi:chromosome segregation ATPase